MPNLNKEEWEKKFSNMGKDFDKKNKVCNIIVFGGIVNVLKGGERSTGDVDIWVEGINDEKGISGVLISEFKEVLEVNDMIFNPIGETNNKNYVQCVQKGIAQVGDIKESKGLELFNSKGIKIKSIPYENLIISKLIQANPKGLEDIKFLSEQYKKEYKNKDLKKEVLKRLNNIPKNTKETILENMIYLDLLKVPNIEL